MVRQGELPWLEWFQQHLQRLIHHWTSVQIVVQALLIKVSTAASLLKRAVDI